MKISNEDEVREIFRYDSNNAAESVREAIVACLRSGAEFYDAAWKAEKPQNPKASLGLYAISRALWTQHDSIAAAELRPKFVYRPRPMEAWLARMEQTAESRPEPKSSACPEDLAGQAPS